MEEKMEQRYDLLIIGAGPGGYIAAEKAAKMGMDVVIIDEKEIGGTCVNRGCIPTKALIYASSLYKDMTECEQFGIHAEKVEFDLQKIYNYKDDSSREMREDLRKTFRELGITFIHGKGTIQRNRKVRVAKPDGTTEIISAKNILIATGAKANVPDIPGMDLPEVMTSEELMVTNKSQYRRFLILGGGVIGLEIANVFNNLGSEITIIEAADRLLPKMDIEFSGAVEKILMERGVKLRKNSRLMRIEKSEGGLLCTYVFEGEEYQEEVDGVLVSVGRRANIDGLFDPDVPVKIENGRIVVDDFFMTSIPKVYAVGDVIGGVQLAHVASAQATYVVDRMNEKEPSVILSMVPSCLFVSMSIIPSCLYMEPEIASVGLSEEEAKEKGVPVRCGHYVMAGNGRSIISHDEEGFIKVVFAADSDVLLGAQIMCPRATDMIGELATAIANSLTSRQLMYAMRAHPTYNEAISNAVEDSRK